MADVMDQFTDSYIKKYYTSADQLKLMHDIQACRTAALGSHQQACMNCGNVKIHYNSCGNRGCPSCQGVSKERWILERNYDLLPVKHFHVVFTLPDQMRELCRQNQKQCYNILFQSAWKTLEAFSQDPKHNLEARMGMIAVLHTWTQKLIYHPHIHCIVPAGGLSDAGYWKHSKSEGKYLFPGKALASTFRGKVMEKVIKLYKTEQLVMKGQIECLKNKNEFWQWKKQLYDKQWVVYAKAPFNNSAQILEYLARYTHKIAISNHRILSMDQHTVTFSYLDRNDNKIKTLTLRGEQFIARFLSHVLPKGYCKIRHC